MPSLEMQVGGIRQAQGGQQGANTLIPGYARRTPMTHHSFSISENEKPAQK